MKKLIILIVFACVVYIGYSQEVSKYRMSDKQRKQLVKKGNTNFVIIEQFLDKNKQYLEENKEQKDRRKLTNLLDPTPYINNLKKTDIKNICTDCYLEEYYIQENQQDEIIQYISELENRAKRSKDSINSVERKRIENIRLTEQLKKDSLNAVNKFRETNNSERNAYDGFIMSMEMLGRNEAGHRYFTVFCDIDLDLASNRLGLYLQDKGLTYSEDDFTTPKNQVKYKFIPSVSTNNDYLTITYTYDEDKTKLSYATAVTGSHSPCYSIKSVEITGTKDLVLSLYLDYWGLSNLKLGGYKGSETSYNDYMGDHVGFIPINNKTSKIKITKRENVEMNYYKNYKIE